jgi:hypothetical protein
MLEARNRDFSDHRAEQEIIPPDDEFLQEFSIGPRRVSATAFLN